LISQGYDGPGSLRDWLRENGGRQDIMDEGEENVFEPSRTLGVTMVIDGKAFTNAVGGFVNGAPGITAFLPTTPPGSSFQHLILNRNAWWDMVNNQKYSAFSYPSSRASPSADARVVLNGLISVSATTNMTNFLSNPSATYQTGSDGRRRT
jgi:hypothetical protein